MQIFFFSCQDHLRSVNLGGCLGNSCALSLVFVAFANVLNARSGKQAWLSAPLVAAFRGQISETFFLLQTYRQIFVSSRSLQHMMDRCVVHCAASYHSAVCHSPGLAPSSLHQTLPAGYPAPLPASVSPAYQFARDPQSGQLIVIPTEHLPHYGNARAASSSGIGA